MKCVTFYLLATVVSATWSSDENAFPENFLLGVGSSSYQIEGAWDEDGKGPNIWDTLTHMRPSFIAEQSNGDVACNSYHLYKDDVELVKALGVDFYRFSISWARILPTGHVHKLNKAGIDYYNNLINELKSKNIEPVVTMYHWDLPQNLQDLGGWANPIISDYFEDYAHILFNNFGDRVKWWITINEPTRVTMGYGTDVWAPNINAEGIGDYMALHNILLAHAKVYHLYSNKFRKTQKGKVGMSFYCEWYEPSGNASVNVAAAERTLQFKIGLYAHPIFSVQGDFPAEVKERVARKSKEEGFSRSRLLAFTANEIKYIKGTSDFFGINHYTTQLIQHNEHKGADADVEMPDDPEWSSTEDKMVPSGFRKILVWIKKEYNNPPVIVTENGCANSNNFHDMERIKFYTSYMSEMLKAVKTEGCNIIGYTAWSLMDSFEWAQGYMERFGLYYVNFTDPERRRIPKDSAFFFSEIAKTRLLPSYQMIFSDEEENFEKNKGQDSASTSGSTKLFYVKINACVIAICIYVKNRI